jgi:hypothetical protein
MTKVKKLLGVMFALGILLTSSVFSTGVSAACSHANRRESRVTVLNFCHVPENYYCHVDRVTYQCINCPYSWTETQHVG